LIQVLSFLHGKNIAHRDLKLSNILVNSQYEFKLADFGMAKMGILKTCCGTPLTMAP
jgi:serine/threonine protein kinase